MVKSVLRPDDEALFSASSLSWQVNRNWFPLLGGARAAILQVCDPLVAAGVANYQLYINPNKAAEELVDPALQDYAALNIPEDLLATAEFVMDVGAYESAYQDIWMEFKLK